MCSSNRELLIFCAFILAAAPASAQEPRFDVGVAVAVDAADGEPANDIPGVGVLGRYRLTDQWKIAASMSRTEYDYERPAEVTGIKQDPMVEVIDALAEATVVRAWFERSLSDVGRPTQFFVGAGVGAAFVDVPDVSGARADGGRFDIHTEAETEIIASLTGGARLRFGERWYGEAAARLEQHFTDWRSTDRITGAQGHIDDYPTWGVQLAIGYRW